jgi:flagellar basal body P-ring protein FlgI
MSILRSSTRLVPGSAATLCAALSAILSAAVLAGCGDAGLRAPDLAGAWEKVNPFDGTPFTRSQSPDEDDDGNPLETTVETPLIGDYTTIAGLNYITLQGVGLVVGLDGKGGDPPPSHYREILLEEMRRMRVPNPQQLLASPDTTLVVVRAYLPPLVRKGDRFDVEVRVPGDDDTKSLSGGWLMKTYLTEHALVPGQGMMKGRDYATAEGPILVAPDDGEGPSDPSILKRGRVLGGGTSRAERDLTIYLRSDFASFRNSIRIAERIGTRFYHYDEHGIRKALAEAKTHQRIELKLLPRYRENYPRYLQVIRSIAFRETDVERRVRMEKLAQKLNNGPTAEKAALQLEAIGNEAVPILEEALKNPDIEVRFHAAMALTYLGDADGIPHLAEAAREEPAFRVHALAALSAAEDASAHVELRGLMGGESVETRYGAFRALSVLDEHDPFIAAEPLPKAEDPAFLLHALHTDGEPMVHLTNSKKAEVVLFGADQKFQTPLALRAGRKILVTASAGSDTVLVSRYAVGQDDRRERVPNRIADVLRMVAELGASYPDVAGLLMQADNQHNLPGRLGVDAVPEAGRIYVRHKDGRQSKARVGNSGLQPNLFDEVRSPARPDDAPQDRAEPGEAEPDAARPEDGGASAADASSGSGHEDEPTGDDALLKDKRKWYDVRRLLDPLNTAEDGE